jgi:hypothetical protein
MAVETKSKKLGTLFMQRPTAVTVFGILNIVFAALGIFGIFASIALLAAAGQNSNNPMIQIIHDNPGYAAYLKISTVLGMFVSLALLAAGIGLLLLQPWARVLSIAYGIFAIVSVPVNTIISFIFVTQPMLAQMQQHQSNAATTGAAVGGLAGSLIGGCFGLIYPVLLLIFMLRANIKAAFNPSASETRTDGPST